MTMRRRLAILLGACTLVACATRSTSPATSLPPGAEARSLLGAPLVPVPPSAAAQARLSAQLADAEREWRRDTTNADALIWYGRRLAYLGRYRDAIAAFTLGMRLHPRDARFPRHRGHRHLTVRELDAAVRDFEAAAALVRGRPDEVEPDGQPNAANIPTSTLQFNIWYHLALARHLQGDWRRALAAYDACMRVSTNPDAIVATAYWQHMTARLAGDSATAARALAAASRIDRVIENDAYLRLVALYAGRVTPETLVPSRAESLDDATTAYGVATWYALAGRSADADRLLARVLAGPQWASFGYLAAEARVARTRR